MFIPGDSPDPETEDQSSPQSQPFDSPTTSSLLQQDNRPNFNRFPASSSTSTSSSSSPSSSSFTSSAGSSMLLMAARVPSVRSANFDPNSSDLYDFLDDAEASVSFGASIDRAAYSQIPDVADPDYDDEGVWESISFSPARFDRPFPPQQPPELPEGRCVRFTCRSKPVKSFDRSGYDDDRAAAAWYCASLDRLPLGILQAILAHLDPADLCRLAQVSHRLHNVACLDGFWKQHYVERFGVAANANFRDDYCSGYKDLFAEQCIFLRGLGDDAEQGISGQEPGQFQHTRGTTPNRLRQSVDSGPEQVWSDPEEDAMEEWLQQQVEEEEERKKKEEEEREAEERKRREQEEEVGGGGGDGELIDVQTIEMPNLFYATALPPRRQLSDDDEDW